MERLVEAIDEPAEADLFALTARQLLDSTRELIAARNRLDAEPARRVRRAELTQAPVRDGQQSMASWLRGHGRLSNAAAAQPVRNGCTTEQLPAVAAARASGDLTGEQVSVIARITGPRYLRLFEAQGGDVAATAAVPAAFAATGRTRTWCSWWHVPVRIAAGDLADPGTGKGAADLGFGGVLSAARARQAACDADLRRYLLGPDGELLDLGRTHRLVTPAIRRASSPAAQPPPGGARSTTSSSGSWAGRPAWRTRGCSANATTPRSTTASASHATPPGAGTPTARRHRDPRPAPTRRRRSREPWPPRAG